MSKGRKGEELAGLGQLVAGGAVAFTDDGAPVASAALDAAGARVLEDVRPGDHAALPGARADRRRRHERGFRVDAAGPGRACRPPPRTSWSPATSAWPRSPAAGCTSSTSPPRARSSSSARASGAGSKVTAEACPHHFTLTDERLRTFDSNYKMNPPLRTWSDVEAVIDGLKDGTIEILATDHAPHAPEKKMRELDQAPFGIIGLETLVPITVTQPDRARPPDLARVIRKLTINPARAPGHPQGHPPPRRRRRRHPDRPDHPLDHRPRRGSAPRAATAPSPAGRSGAGPTPSSSAARSATPSAGSSSRPTRRRLEPLPGRIAPATMMRIIEAKARESFDPIAFCSSVE